MGVRRKTRSLVLTRCRYERGTWALVEAKSAQLVTRLHSVKKVLLKTRLKI